MALQQDAIFKRVPVAGAYFRVSDVRMFKDAGRIEILVGVYANGENLSIDDRLTQVIFSVDHDFKDMDGVGTWAWAYAHLKTLPEFTDAVDA